MTAGLTYLSESLDRLDGEREWFRGFLEHSEPFSRSPIHLRAISSILGSYGVSSSAPLPLDGLVSDLIANLCAPSHELRSASLSVALESSSAMATTLWPSMSRLWE